MTKLYGVDINNRTGTTQPANDLCPTLDSDQYYFLRHHVLAVTAAGAWGWSLTCIYISWSFTSTSLIHFHGVLF